MPPTTGLNVGWLANRLKAGEKTTLLVVCSANFVRSPYATFKLRRLLRKLPAGKSGLVHVESGAMLFNRKGDGMFGETWNQLTGEGFSEGELATHDPRYVKAPEHRHLLEEADVIIGFERAHVRGAIPKQYRAKGVLLAQFVAGEARDIVDPYLDFSPELFARVIAEINSLLGALVGALLEALQD